MSNLVTLYVVEFGAALKALFPLLPANAITVGYQKAITKNPTFIVWTFRNISQQIFAGGQGNRGIDRPTFLIDIVARNLTDATAAADKIMDTWQGFTGFLTPNLFVTKIRVTVGDHAYTDEGSFHSIAVDVDLEVTIQQ